MNNNDNRKLALKAMANHDQLGAMMKEMFQESEVALSLMRIVMAGTEHFKRGHTDVARLGLVVHSLARWALTELAIYPMLQQDAAKKENSDG